MSRHDPRGAYPSGKRRFRFEVVVAPHQGIHCYRFTWNPVEGSLPLSFMRAACFNGVQEALRQPLADGRQIAFIEVSILDGSYHDLDTDEQATAIAAALAVRDALTGAELTAV
jgi:hypothetical protein